MKWYSKYLSVYEKPFEAAPAATIATIKENLQQLQNDQPLVSVVVIAYNEGKRLLGCLWSLSESQCKYPVEIIGVNNNSKDNTEDVYKAVGLPYYNELKQSPGYARLCGLNHARGKYYICIDADTLYPPGYIELMVSHLEQPGVAGVYSLWSYMPDEKHSWLGVKLYELLRDIHLRIQSARRPELSVRGMVFGYHTEWGRQVGFPVHIKRGEDGMMALGLKKYGRLFFLRNRAARVITGYGTVGKDGSFFNSFIKRAFANLKGLKYYFTKENHYKDRKENIIE
ncbi:glycosyltransferase family 2 protein [Niabella soli]|uniref:Glycosyl transferase family A n=1 Tax=Niabella soli DSM 19437 TaxID=929713 RepID=W0ETQ1_9BACT|nr:glycosyltransferase family 2 protein [Niabella soli]AHF14160.1 glycosyl transferase family A [Niabella soli DSM 19437]